MVSIFSRLSLYPDINKISKETSIVAGSLCWKATPDIGFIEQLVQFQQAPEEVKKKKKSDLRSVIHVFTLL